MKGIVLAMIAFAAGCLWWLDAEHGTVGSSQDAGSTLERGPQGLSLARAYLDEVAGRRTALLTRPLAQADLPADAVVLRIGSPVTAASRLPLGRNATKTVPVADGDEAWVAGGGRLVLATTGEMKTGAEPPLVVLPALPGVSRLAPQSRQGLAAPAPDAAPVITAGPAVVVARRQVGAGDIWLIACPEIFSNGHLGEADHLPLLLALVGERPVWFDERIHGLLDEDDLIALLRRWGLGPALVLGALLVVLWFWRARVLLGPPADPWRDRRAEAVEGIQALAGLYQRSLSRRDTLELYRQRLLREVVLRTGQRPVVARATVDRLTEGLRLPPGEPGDHDFRLLMHRFNQAFRSLRDEHRRRRP
jgi:hypothetical protein